MPDWNTRLVVSFTEPGQTPVTITPIESFTPSFALAADPVHSIESTHVGVIYNTRTITFTMTVRAIGNVVGQLTALALNGKTFEILLQQQEGDDWSFSRLVMGRCLITSAQPGAVTTQGAPLATFSGFSLDATATPKAGEEIAIP